MVAVVDASRGSHAAVTTVAGAADVGDRAPLVDGVTTVGAASVAGIRVATGLAAAIDGAGAGHATRTAITCEEQMSEANEVMLTKGAHQNRRR